MKKSTFFKELTPRSQTYELRSQGEKKMYQIKTNTSHCPTKTNSKNIKHPLKTALLTFYVLLTLKGRVVKKIDIFKELAPHLRTYELRSQGKN